MTKLEELLNVITKDHVYIQMHNYPDQDALASAYGLQILLQAKGKESTICYKGQIEKQNTRKMLELLPIAVYNIKEIILANDDEIILVDGQKGNMNMEELTGYEIGCIDHHPMQDVNRYEFYDIRSNAGACASIITEYFIKDNVPMTKDAATALLYGIKIDTDSLTRKVSDLDLDMFYFLYKKANLEKLHSFDNSSLCRNDLEAYKNAISTLKIYDGIGISYTGAESSEALIGSISDFLMELSEVEFSLVYSYRAGGLRFSARSESKTINAGNIIKAVLFGYGDGGGHSSMAAGFIPGIPSEEEARNIADIVENRVIQAVHNSKL